MSTKKKPLSDEEIRSALDGVKPILLLTELAELLNVPEKTIYEWIAKDRLNGTFRRRGKPYLFWRDRVIKLVFNGPEWESNDKEQ